MSITQLQKKPRRNGSPVKRRKLNEVSSFDEEIDQGLNLNMTLTLNKKKSLIDCFHFVGAIHRKDSCKLPMLRKQSNVLGFGSFGSFREDGDDGVVGKQVGMDAEFGAQIMSSSSSQQLPRDIKLVKRITMMNIPHTQILPKLFRCNSGIDIEQQLNETEQRKYGDNIYLQQINALRRRNTLNSKQNNSKAANRNFTQNYNRKSYQIDSDDSENDGGHGNGNGNEQERLLKDYQISSNLNAYVRNHENYLCLNKLERIFYYVKKINFQGGDTQDDVFELCQAQIKLYNRDDQSHMLRFYQSWQEDDCLYMVFQTASTSLQQKLQTGIKLRQPQIWSLLTTTSQTLTWLKSTKESHLNIKPGNLLKCRQKYKLSDPYINAATLSKALNMFKGEQYEEEKLRLAFAYAAPEILEYRGFIQGLDFQKCDVFSLGICVLENLCGVSVGLLKRDLKFIKRNCEKYLKGYSPMLKNLLMRMTSLDPQKRPTSDQLTNTLQLQNFQLNPNPQKQPQKPPRKLSL